MDLSPLKRGGAAALAFPCSIPYAAEKHGVYDIDPDTGGIRRIVYREGAAALKTLQSKD